MKTSLVKLETEKPISCPGYTHQGAGLVAREAGNR
jgi:hypothetical protein